LDIAAAAAVFAAPSRLWGETRVEKQWIDDPPTFTVPVGKNSLNNSTLMNKAHNNSLVVYIQQV